jgi:hypothetical protein
MDRWNLTGRGSDSNPDPVAAIVAPIVAAGRAPLVTFEGDIDNLAIVVLGGGNISYITFPTLIDVPRLTEPDLRNEEGLRVGGTEGWMGMSGRAVNEISNQHR